MKDQLFPFIYASLDHEVFIDKENNNTTFPRYREYSHWTKNDLHAADIFVIITFIIEFIATTQNLKVGSIR